MAEWETSRARRKTSHYKSARKNSLVTAALRKGKPIRTQGGEGERGVTVAGGKRIQRQVVLLHGGHTGEGCRGYIVRVITKRGKGRGPEATAKWENLLFRAGERGDTGIVE